MDTNILLSQDNDDYMYEAVPKQQFFIYEKVKQHWSWAEKKGGL